MINRGETAKHARHVFFKGLNDIDVFIEDTATEARKIYSKLITRALDDEVRITEIFPIGSKSKVIHACARDQGTRKRKAIYIIDGDFDLLSGQPNPDLKRLYTLKRYSIENYLIDGNAIASILDEEIVDKPLDEITKLLAFNEWLDEISEKLRPLIIAAAAGKMNNCAVKTVTYPIREICSTDCGHVDPIKIHAKTQEIKSSTDKICKDDRFDNAAAQISARAPQSNQEFLIRHAPGKNLIFPLLKRRLIHIFKFTHQDDRLRLRLSAKCDIIELRDITKILC